MASVVVRTKVSCSSKSDGYYDSYVVCKATNITIYKWKLAISILTVSKAVLRFFYPFGIFFVFVKLSCLILTLVNVYVDLVVFTRIAGTS